MRMFISLVCIALFCFAEVRLSKEKNKESAKHPAILLCCSTSVVLETLPYKVCMADNSIQQQSPVDSEPST